MDDLLDASEGAALQSLLNEFLVLSGQLNRHVYKLRHIFPLVNISKAADEIIDVQEYVIIAFVQRPDTFAADYMGCPGAPHHRALLAGTHRLVPARRLRLARPPLGHLWMARPRLGALRSAHRRHDSTLESCRFFSGDQQHLRRACAA